MTSIIRCIVAVVFVLFLGGCTPDTPPTTTFTTHMHLDGSELQLIKATSQEQFFDLASELPTLNDNKGIWYVLDKDGITCIGMQYTTQNVEVAFLNADNQITEFSHLKAHGSSGCPHQEIRSILELPDNWLEQHHVSIGSRLTN